MARLRGKLQLLALAAANVRNKFAEWLYLRSGVDWTRPMQVYGEFNARCNARCLMCNYWRQPEKQELPAATWIAALQSLRRLSRRFHLQLCAVEPLLRGAELFEVLDFCRDAGISCGITTNGQLLNAANIARLLSAGVLNVNVSIDSLDGRVHERIRGVPGILPRVLANVEAMTAEARRAGGRTRVLLRPLVCRENLAGLCELVEFAGRIGAAGINFQPISRATDEAGEMFRVDLALLDSQIERLLAMRRAGAPILNSEPSIRWWGDYFRERPVPPRDGPCVVALRNLYLSVEGDVTFCRFGGAKIGNIASGDLAEMWRSPAARKARAELVRCDRVCVGTSLEKKRWRDYFETFRRLVG